MNREEERHPTFNEEVRRLQSRAFSMTIDQTPNSIRMHIECPECRESTDGLTQVGV
jgi:hypothetical protein